jgi:hypothetical protein
VDETGFVVAGRAVLREDVDGATLLEASPHVFVVDVRWDGTVRQAGLCRWDARWRLVPTSLQVARGARREVFVGATLAGAEFGGQRPGSSDAVLMRLGTDLRWEWAQAYGGLLNEELLDVVPTSDGGALLVGQSRSAEVRGDAWVLRVGPDGRIGEGGCQAERERVVPAETFDLDVTVTLESSSGAVPNAVPPGEILDVVTPNSPTIPASIVARQCTGVSTPLPRPLPKHPLPPPPPPTPPPPTPDPTRTLHAIHYPANPTIETTVNFLAYFDPVGDPPGLTYSWWFEAQGGAPDVTGPGPGSAGQTHVFTAQGTYTVRVRAEYGIGVVQEATTTVVVVAP